MQNSHSRHAASGCDASSEREGSGYPRSMFLKRFGWLMLVSVSIVCVVMLALGSSGVIFFILGEIASDQSITRTRMTVTKRRILLYAHQNNRLPKTLTEIPSLAGFDNSIKDGWGRPLQYQINNKTVTLKSYGQDGLPGGNGENADIIQSFPTHDVDGGWSDPLVGWLQD